MKILRENDRRSFYHTAVLHTAEGVSKIGDDDAYAARD